MMMVTTTDTMMTMTEVVSKWPAESVQCRGILQMTIMAHNGIIFPTCTPYLDHVSDSEVLYITFILEEDIVSVQKVEHLIRCHLVIINVWCTCPS